MIAGPGSGCPFSPNGRGRGNLPHRCFSGRESGFTLFELMFVMVLAGFIVALSAPNFRDAFWPRDMKRTTLSLVGALRYAQSQAATTKQPHRLEMNVEENAFWVSRAGEEGVFTRDPSPRGNPVYLPAGIGFLDVNQPGREKMRGGMAFVHFSPTGWAEESTIHLKKGENEVFTIFIHPLGGKVELAEGYLERRKG